MTEAPHKSGLTLITQPARLRPEAKQMQRPPQQRRVRFQGVLREPPAGRNASARYPVASSSDEDEDERSLREEQEAEEEERLLSEQHGEAGETSSKNRSTETDKEIEDEFASVTRAKKKRRPTFSPSDLISSSGLVRIKHEFSKSIKYRYDRAGSSQAEKRRDREREAAAAYGRSFIGAYQSFCYDLFPSLAFEDMLTRIETFGSKKEVKLYLQNMREDVRNSYLKGIYGNSKAERMLNELEHGLSQQLQKESANCDDENSGGSGRETNDIDDDAVVGISSHSSNFHASQEVAVKNPYGNKQSNGDNTGNASTRQTAEVILNNSESASAVETIKCGSDLSEEKTEAGSFEGTEIGSRATASKQEEDNDDEEQKIVTPEKCRNQAGVESTDKVIPFRDHLNAELSNNNASIRTPSCDKDRSAVDGLNDDAGEENGTSALPDKGVSSTLRTEGSEDATKFGPTNGKSDHRIEDCAVADKTSQKSAKIPSDTSQTDFSNELLVTNGLQKNANTASQEKLVMDASQNEKKCGSGTCKTNTVAPVISFTAEGLDADETHSAVDFSQASDDPEEVLFADQSQEEISLASESTRVLESLSYMENGKPQVDMGLFQKSMDY